MLINDATIATALRGFRALAADAVAAAPKHAERIAMRVTLTTTEETYPWLGSWPMMREWVGPRLVHKLKAHGYSIRNRKFESTVEIDRDTFADDKIGLHAPMVAQLGHAAAQHVEELVFGLLGDGFTELGYDGQPFFDTDHPVEDAATGATTLISNFGGGSGTAWYLLDTSQPIRPLILQWREELEFTALNRAAWAAFVGPEAAQRLADRAHLLPRRVPLANRWLTHCLAAEGHTTAEIARRPRCSDVAVRGYLKTDPRRG